VIASDGRIDAEVLGRRQRAVQADAGSRDPRLRGNGRRRAQRAGDVDGARGERSTVREVQSQDVSLVPPVERRGPVRLPEPVRVGALGRAERELPRRPGRTDNQPQDVRPARPRGLLAARLSAAGLHPGVLAHGQAEGGHRLQVVLVVRLRTEVDEAHAGVGGRVGHAGAGSGDGGKKGDPGRGVRRAGRRSHGMVPMPGRFQASSLHNERLRPFLPVVAKYFGRRRYPCA
jgi:hypothetical protein